MEFIDYLTLPIILAIGAVVSWEDFRLKKVRNIWIFWGLIYGVGVLLVLFLNSLVFDLWNYNLLFLDSAIIPLSYWLKVLINSLISFVIVFFLWSFELLPAGDAKLVFLFSFLTPLKYYWQSYLPLYPSFALIINIFVPIFFYFFARGVFLILKNIYLFTIKKKKIDFSKNETKEKVKKLFERISLNILRILAILVLVGMILNYFGLFYDAYGYFFPLLFIFYRGLNLFLVKTKNFKARVAYHLLLILFICGIFIANTFKFGLGQAAHQFWFIVEVSFYFSILFMVLMAVAQLYIQRTGIRKVHIDDLKPGMVLGSDKYMLPQIGSVSSSGLTPEQRTTVCNWARKNGLNPEEACQKIGSVHMGELTSSQIELIKKWSCNNKDIDQLEVYQKFPFAGFVFAGVVLTLIIKQSVIIWVIDLF